METAAESTMRDQKLREASVLCGVLANENRLQILCHLVDSERNVTELRERMEGISQPALSQHLALLKAHRIVESRKCGQSVVYKIVDEKSFALIQMLRALYGCDHRPPDVCAQAWPEGQL